MPRQDGPDEVNAALPLTPEAAVTPAFPVDELVPQSAGVLHMSQPSALAGSQEVHQLVKRLYAACAANGGMGLAAPQIGVAAAVAVVAIPGAIKFAMVNPVIKKVDGPYQLAKEGCLSVPGVQVMKMRRSFVEVIFQDENGKFHKIGTGGLLARVILHEIAHLRGELIVDGALRVIKPPEEKSDEPKPEAHADHGVDDSAQREGRQANPEPRFASEVSDAAE